MRPPSTSAGRMHFRARREDAGRSSASEVLPAGGWRGRCAPCRRASGIGARPLVLRRGSASTVIAGLAREVDAAAVYWNEIAQAPHQAGRGSGRGGTRCDWRHSQISGDLLVAPSQIRNKENRGLRVFTPFWRRVQSLGDPPKPLPAPKKLNGVSDIAGDTLEDWHLEPTRPDWAGGLRESWTPGEAAAQARLKAFPRRRYRRLFRRSRPARPRGHLAAVAASALRRNQPAPGLARRKIRRRRAPSPVIRYR